MSDNHSIDNREGLLKAILATLAYFDVFKHPLTFEEILEYNCIPGCTREAVESALVDMMAYGLVRKNRNFFFLGQDETIVDRRISANQFAQKRMRAAWFYSSLIARFPFIRAVMISGSLSKGVMDADDDIDFFILTAPGRLWIARVLLTLFKRVFLLNSHRNFCLNYFIDTDHLAIPDQNIFTATEIGLILPMYNKELYLKFLEENIWFRAHYPNLPDITTVKDTPARYAGQLIERLLPFRLWNIMDDVCLRLTRRFLGRKYKYMNSERFYTDLKTSKSVSRHHPESQQYIVLESYQKTIEFLEGKLDNAVSANELQISYGETA